METIKEYGLLILVFLIIASAFLILWNILIPYLGKPSATILCACLSYCAGTYLRTKK